MPRWIERHFLWYRHLPNQSEMMTIIGGHNPLMNPYGRSNDYDNLIMDITLPPDFKKFLRLFNDHKVRYLMKGFE
jgi:hypothetical protein